MKNTKNALVVPFLILITVLILAVWLSLFMEKTEVVPQVAMQTANTPKNSPFDSRGLYTFQKIDDIGTHLASFLNAYHVALSVNGFPQVTVGPNSGGPSPVSYVSEENRINLMYSIYYPDCPAHYVANYFLGLSASVPESVQAKTAALAKFRKDLSCLGKVVTAGVAVSQL